jgi:hypothetical protein
MTLIIPFKMCSLHVLRFSVLPALSLYDGILHCDIVEGSFDSQLFYQFIERVLDQMQPYPAPNSVIRGVQSCHLFHTYFLLNRFLLRNYNK